MSSLGWNEHAVLLITDPTLLTLLLTLSHGRERLELGYVVDIHVEQFNVGKRKSKTHTMVTDLTILCKTFLEK